MIDTSSIQYLVAALNKTNLMVQHVDTQSNILIGVSTAIFIFSVSRLESSSNLLVLVTLGVTAAVSALIGLVGLHPPRFYRKKGQKESIIFPSAIAKYKNAESYIEVLQKDSQDFKKVSAELSRELYNISKYYYLPKRKFYRYSRNIMLLGILFALGTYLFELIY